MIGTIGQNSDLLLGLPKPGGRELAHQEIAVKRVEPVERAAGSAREGLRLAGISGPALKQPSPDQPRPRVAHRAVALPGHFSDPGAWAPFLVQMIAQSEPDDARAGPAPFAAREAAGAYRRTAASGVSYFGPYESAALEL